MYNFYNRIEMAYFGSSRITNVHTLFNDKREETLKKTFFMLITKFVVADRKKASANDSDMQSLYTNFSELTFAPQQLVNILG